MEEEGWNCRLWKRGEVAALIKLEPLREMRVKVLILCSVAGKLSHE